MFETDSAQRIAGLFARPDLRRESRKFRTADFYRHRVDSHHGRLGRPSALFRAFGSVFPATNSHVPSRALLLAHRLRRADRAQLRPPLD